MDIQNQIDDFFSRYERQFNNALKGQAPDIESVTGSFADCFIEASPVGIICGKNDEDFKKMIPEGYNNYRQIGITSMTIPSKEIIMLDDLHVVTMVKWNSSFTRKNKSKGEFAFDVIYLLQAREGIYKIFGYITGDEQKALKDLGLV